MQALSHITLDLTRPGLETVYAAQDDSGARGVAISLTVGGVAWTPPSGTIAMIEVKKPDGTECVYDVLEDNETPAYSIDGSTITVLWAAQALTVPGDARAAIRFYNAAEERLTTFSFRLRIPAGACPDSGLTSSDYYNILTQQIAGVLGAATHPPLIDPTTRKWMLWDQSQNDYVVSAYSSEGIQGPPEIPTTTIRYQSGSSPTTAPSGTWSENIPSVAAGDYLWTRTVLTFSDGTTATYYSVARQGENGAGTVLTTYTNKAVSANDWEDERANGGTPTYASYPYHADITCPGVTVSTVADAVYAPDDAESGNFAPVCDTATDKVRIWAASPEAVTIPTIRTWR